MCRVPSSIAAQPSVPWLFGSVWILDNWIYSIWQLQLQLTINGLLYYFATISTKCSATVTRDGKCSVFLSSDLSRMCDMVHGQKVFSSAQIYSFWVMLTGCWGRCCQVSHCHPRLWKLKQGKTDPIQTQYAPAGAGKGTETYLLDVLLWR